MRRKAKKPEQEKNEIFGIVKYGEFRDGILHLKIGPTGAECELNLNGKPLELVQKVTIVVEANSVTKLYLEMACPNISKP